VRPCRSAGRSPRSTETCTVGARFARYYDPSTAQFLSRDPLEDITGQPYAYASDDPIDNSDPTGLHWYDDASNWVAGFGDTLTLGGTAQVRRLINYEVKGDMSDVVDTCSTFYTWGGYGGLDAGFGLGAEDAADVLGSGWKWVRSDDGGWIRIRGLPDEPPEGTPGTVQRTGPSQTGPARDALGNPFGTARTWPLKIGAIITRLGQILAGTHHG
jgi:RHS repeat-associated protein